MRRIISRPHRLIAKSLSRFSRNTVDSLTTIRKLKENGVEVWFEKENIWTFQARGEILLTILSSLSQEEARSISENVTWGLRKKFQDGKFSVGYSRFLGYDKGEDGNLAINEEQAKTVRLIFGLFIEGLTPCAIAKELNNPHGTNIIMLGALAGASDLYDTAHVKAGMEHYFEKKGKNNPKNALCFDKGAEAATAQR